MIFLFVTLWCLVFWNWTFGDRVLRAARCCWYYIALCALIGTVTWVGVGVVSHRIVLETCESTVKQNLKWER